MQFSVVMHTQRRIQYIDGKQRRRKKKFMMQSKPIHVQMRGVFMRHNVYEYGKIQSNYIHTRTRTQNLSLTASSSSQYEREREGERAKTIGITVFVNEV